MDKIFLIIANIVLAISVLLGQPVMVDSSCITRDRAVLTDLYNATDGANWTNKTNWLSDKPLGEWYGVNTDGQGCVIKIDLSGCSTDCTGNNLIGKIPKEIGQLTNITELYLQNNALSGLIPKEVSQLTNLTDLNLGENKLSGTIPKELSQLTNLIWLKLNGNELSGPIPKEIGQLIKLIGLGLGNNQLSDTIPKELGQLTNLISLNLKGNELSGSIPKEIGQLVNLIEFSIDNNQLSESIPKELGKLTNLIVLTLHHNKLSDTIPKELSQLANLTLLSLHDNELSGPIPKELGELTNLTELWLNNNQLSGAIPKELGELTNLEQLQLVNNQLSGCFPQSFKNLCYLTTTVLQDCSWNDELEGCQYNFRNNPQLFEGGDFARFCREASQIGVPCNDNNSCTINDAYDADCNCVGIATSSLITIEERICEGTKINNQLILSDTIMIDTFMTDFGCDSIIERVITYLPPPSIEDQLIDISGLTDLAIPLYDVADCPDCRSTIISSDQMNCREKDPNSNWLECTRLSDNCDSLKIIVEVCREACPALCDTVTIQLYSQQACKIPYFVTPNGDGESDRFVIPAIYNTEENKDYELFIFNRWGEQVHHETTYHPGGWNGTYDKTGNPLPDGSYFYLLHLKKADGKFKKGEISIIR